MDAHLTEARRDGDRLVRDDPDLVGEPAHLHREAHRRVDRPDPLGLQGGDDSARDLVDLVARVVEFQVGDRPGRAADRLAVHPADDADESLRPRVEAEYLGPLVVEFLAVDGHEADVIGPGIQADSPQLLDVDTPRAGAGLGLSEADHAGMVFELGHAVLLVLFLAEPSPPTPLVAMVP